MPTQVNVRGSDGEPWHVYGVFGRVKDADRASAEARIIGGYRTHTFPSCAHIPVVGVELCICRRCKAALDECDCLDHDGAPDKKCTRCGGRGVTPVPTKQSEAK